MFQPGTIIERWYQPPVAANKIILDRRQLIIYILFREANALRVSFQGAFDFLLMNRGLLRLSIP
jgi:hypothetical protein